MKKRQPLTTAVLLQLLLLFLVACSGNANLAEPEAEIAAEPTEEADTETETEEADTMSNEEDSHMTAESHLVTVDHELGSTTIDYIPERIVVLEYSFADHLGTLGIAPVGHAVDAPPDYIYGYTSDVGSVEVGTRAEPSLEVIAELNPDFIIGDLRRHSEIYDLLSEIAPTVIFNSLRGSYDDQLEQFNQVAEIVGKEAEAADILAEYDARFAEVQATTDGTAGEFVVGVLWDGGFTAHSNQSFMGSFLESLGRTNALEPRGEETQYILDIEGFASVNPGAIVVLCNPTDQGLLDDMATDQLWQSFDAVSNSRVYTFDRNLWSKGRGVTAFQKILEDSVNSGLLADGESQTPTCGGAPEAETSGGEMSDAVPTMVVVDAFGDVEVPNDPQRIIALDEGTMTDLIALGVTPVAVHDWSNRDFSLFLNVDPSSIASVGTPDGPNLEAMLALDPDLIIGRSEQLAWYPEELPEQLAAIAPTVYSPASSVDWQDHLTFLGDVVGRADESADLIASYDTRLAEFAAAWEASGKNETVAIIRSRADSFNIYANDSFIAETVKSAGIAMPESFAEIPDRNSISIEEIDVLTADNLFVMARNEDEAEAFVDAVNGPLWQFIPAVASDQAYQVNWSVWVAGWNAVGAQLVLDDLYFFLLDSAPETPNPILDIVVDEFDPQYDVVRFGGEPLPVPRAEASSEEACADGMRLFESETIAQPVCVPETAQRIVTLEPFYALQMSLELDLPLVGSGTYGEEGGFPLTLSDEQLEGIEGIGAFEAPNLEKLLELEPDLIIGDAWNHSDNLDQLSEIAPTVLISTADWKAWFYDIANAAGVPERTDALFADYDARVAEVGEKLRDVEVSFLRVVPDSFQLYRSAPNAYAPIAIMSEVGVVRTEFETGTDENSWERLDWEGLTFITGDVLIYVMAGADDNDELGRIEQETTENPVWQALPAVEADEAYRVDAAHWMSFGGMTSAYAVLDDIEALLTEE